MNLLIEILRSSLPVSIPIMLAALGGLVTWHADVFNISMEGMLLSSSFFAVLGSYLFESWVAGLLFGVAGGVIMSLLFSFFVLKMRTGEFITGIALNTFSLGMTTYLLRSIFNVKGTLIHERIKGIPVWNIPIIKDIPIIGDVLSGHPFIMYIVLFVIVPSIFILIYKTPFGLHLRGVGENSKVIDAVGVNSDKMKFKAILICGILCGIGGAFLSLGYMTMFIENMSNGRGWISQASIILTNGHPVGVMLMSMIFGLMEGIGFSLQSLKIPSQLTATLPYMSVLVALYINSKMSKKNNRYNLK